jgi:hypothetical protein
MSDLSTDFVTSVIHRQMKAAIRLLVEAKCWSSAAVLIYSGMDTMAWLSMPTGQAGVTRSAFIRWAEHYISFPCKEQLSGEDLYGARCAMVHQYGVESNLSRQGQCRMVGYMNKAIPEVRFQPDVHQTLVLVSVPALAEAFFAGVDRWLLAIGNGLNWETRREV